MDSTPEQLADATALVSRNVGAIARIQEKAETNRTLGERTADFIAAKIGNWNFIIIQSVILTIWVILNICGAFKAWDPYPFILLNLALSFQAAYASPIIMMSQNRQARLSDQRNHLALQIALLAEQEDTETLRLVRKICERLEIPMSEHSKALEEATDPEAVIRDIERSQRMGRK